MLEKELAILQREPETFPGVAREGAPPPNTGKIVEGTRKEPDAAEWEGTVERAAKKETINR